MLIDGSCFIFQLISRSGIDCTNGGDYEDFAIYLAQFLHAFRASNIHLTIVLDGCDPEKKDSTAKSRMLKKQSENRKFFSHQPLSHMKQRPKPPAMMMELFRSVSRAFSNIEIVQSPFEGDPFTAKLAQELMTDGTLKYAGVMTNDSDFMVYESAGFVGQQQLTVQWNKELNAHQVFISRITPEMVAKVLGLPHKCVRN